jgi:hypothetical protein
VHVSARLLAAVFVLTTACAPAARFTGAGLPFGSFELVPDRCFWTSDPATNGGPPLQGLEFVNVAQPGLMVLVVQSTNSGPEILTGAYEGRVIVWQIGNHGATPIVQIPASDCRVFQLSASITAGGSTRARIELDCSTPEGGRVVGQANFWESC